MIDPHIQDFTETNYRKLVQRAKSRWEFSSFLEFAKPGRRILWRHDVDFSMSRSLALAKIEAEEGVRSTFFFMLNSSFYNLLEDANTKIAGEIVRLGHEVGIHVSPNSYSHRDRFDWEDVVTFEREAFRRLLGVEATAFSIHNPDVGPWLAMEDESVGGLVNTYGQKLKQTYRYCSDSNGYWRFDRLEDVLCQATEEKLQVLTHPAWWVPEACMPRERIQAVIDARASATGEEYDQFLKDCGRKNVT